MEFFPLIEGDNEYLYYLVKKGAILYRGDTDMLISNIKPGINFRLHKQSYFGYSEKTAKIYGYIGMFKTNQDLYLLALDQVSNLEKLKSNGDQLIINDLEASFPIIDEVIQRESEANTDKRIAVALCALGFDGYATGPMKEAYTLHGEFHEELMICNSDTVADLIEFVKHQPKEIMNFKAKHRAVLDKRERSRLKTKRAKFNPPDLNLDLDF